MTILVTYASKYGYTQQYAQWIAEALSCDICDSKHVTKTQLQSCDILIHGGGLYAGGLSGIKTIVKNWDVLSNKQVILFSCGVADPTDPENEAHIKAGIARSLTPEMQEKIHQFHLRGGIDYSRLNFIHRAMMGMLRKGLLKKGYENLRGEDKLIVDTYGQALDFRNQAAIEPLVTYVKGLIN